jgi:hypothetical protein
VFVPKLRLLAAYALIAVLSVMAPVPVKVRDVAVRIETVPTFKLFATVNAFPLVLMVTPPINPAVLFMVMDFALAGPDNDIVKPSTSSLMVTSSEEVGTLPVDQLPPVFQSPLPSPRNGPFQVMAVAAVVLKKSEKIIPHIKILTMPDLL